MPKKMPVRDNHEKWISDEVEETFSHALTVRGLLRRHLKRGNPLLQSWEPIVTQLTALRKTIPAEVSKLRK